MVANLRWYHHPPMWFSLSTLAHAQSDDLVLAVQDSLRMMVMGSIAAVAVAFVVSFIWRRYAKYKEQRRLDEEQRQRTARERRWEAIAQAASELGPGSGSVASASAHTGTGGPHLAAPLAAPPLAGSTGGGQWGAAALGGAWGTPDFTGASGGAPRRAIDIESLARFVPGFAIHDFLDFVRTLFQRVHHERPDGGGPTMERFLLDAARESAIRGQPGLQAVRQIRFLNTRLVSSHGGPDGSSVRVSLQAVLQEVHDGAPRFVVWREVWGLSTRGDSWVVRNIERDTPRPLQIQGGKVRYSPGPEDVQALLMAQQETSFTEDPQLGRQVDVFNARNAGHDWEDFRRGAAAVFASVHRAMAEGRVDQAAGLLAPSALEELKTQASIHANPLLSRELSARRVEILRVVGTEVEELVTVGFAGVDAHHEPFVEYWTIGRPIGGNWTVLWIDMTDDVLA